MDARASLPPLGVVEEDVSGHKFKVGTVNYVPYFGAGVANSVYVYTQRNFCHPKAGTSNIGLKAPTSRMNG